MAIILRDQKYKKLVEYMVKKRKELGLTQIQVSEAMKIRQADLSRLETCETQMDIIQLMQLVKVYDIDIKEVQKIIS